MVIYDTSINQHPIENRPLNVYIFQWEDRVAEDEMVR